MIDPDTFDETLRQLIKPETFQPFYVELDDGQKIWIRQPALVIGDGLASLIDPEDGALVGFSHREAIGFHTASREVTR